MIAAIGEFLSIIWNFICSLPFFDTGVSFGQFIISAFSFFMAIALLSFIFGGSNTGSGGAKK